ncbi:cyclase family protein [Paenibacillus sp. N1-5-1-14]|uniref:cyclase family protein n=1 Tax=Paenibacillus radicibacter TaxID=2972488 RepID=UPI0021598A80|nr:cyclase family protein [Paenibacillus radicibacter]MCR8643182.1 cyclase family protein [Paenibacillus radicibacter]
MIIDLSHLIVDGLPPYPGDAETILTQTKFIHTDHYTNHQLSVNMHEGTHIDGPMHLLDVPTYLNEFSLDRFIGSGTVIDVAGQTEIDYLEEYEELIPEAQIVVLHTEHSRLFGQPSYFTDYPVLTLAFAELLVRKHVKMVCLDMPSPDKYPFEVHQLLFANNILIAENLTHVEKLLEVGKFEIIALPLHIRADSSIARIVARVLE